MSRDVPPGRVELAQEQLEISKREVERSRIVIRTRVEERDEVAELELQQEEVTVERIPRGVPVDAKPATREENGVLIVPIVEEQLVVTTRLILKEELRISRRTRTELVRQPVRLRAAERAEVERREGRATTVPDPEQRSSVDDAPDTDRAL
jgi:uncharacterized protein (TIGR02271 family)